MKKRGSFRNQLRLVFALILLVPTISLGVLSYMTAKKSVTAEILHSTQQSVGAINNVVDEVLTQKLTNI